MLQRNHLSLKVVGIAIAALTATVPAGAGSADDALDALVRSYRPVAGAGTWVNPWMAGAAGGHATDAPSGDQQLGALVAGYTRATLDRGGWVNTVLTNAQYSAGYPLLAVAVGQGWTETVAAVATGRIQVASLR